MVVLASSSSCHISHLIICFFFVAVAGLFVIFYPFCSVKTSVGRLV